MFHIKANPQTVSVMDENDRPVYVLKVNQDFVKFTAEMLVRFVEHEKKGIEALLRVPPPSGLWMEDVEYTMRITRAGIMLFGSDYEKFILLASQNVAMVLAKKRFGLRLTRDVGEYQDPEPDPLPSANS